VFALCELQQIEVVIINKGEQPSFEEELAKDVLEIITVFSARLYGARSKKNREIIETLKTTMEVKE
jgi:predicted site-specific integrase-resolvase